MPGHEIIGLEEKNEVMSVMDTGVLFRFGFDEKRQGIWKALEFEAKVAETLNVSHCHSVSSGTSALVTALVACGIGPGDEVIVPPFTFVATIEAALAVGATPVFSTIDETLGLNAEDIERCITPRTRAVILVHMCGCVADVAGAMRVCAAHDLILIEDSCQALGATLNGRSAGSFGAAGCFSFDYVKTITAGEGGAVVSENLGIIERARQHSDHGHDYSGPNRGADGHPIYGTNFRISELHAAVGVAQLRKLPDIINRQKVFYHILADALSGIEGVSLRPEIQLSEGNYSFFTILFSTEAAARHFLGRSADITPLSAIYWYEHNWHYIRQWHHLLSGSLYQSPGNQPDALPRIDKQDRQASDSVMARVVSFPIQLGWDTATVMTAAGKARVTASEALSYT